MRNGDRFFRAGMAGRIVLVAVVCVATAFWAFSEESSPPARPPQNAAASAPALSGPPVIAAPDGVVDAASLDPSRGISSGAWVSIFGSNLAPLTRSWTIGDFSGGKAPTQLDGVSVQINGKPAFISALVRGSDAGLNRDQVNVLTPEDAATGPVQVTVTTEKGTSAPVTVTKLRQSPALFMFDPEGRRYLAASTGDFTEYIGKFGLFGSTLLDRPIRPAHVEDVVVFFGSGFGPADPAVPEGTIPQQAARLARSVSFLFGDVPGVVEYAGVTPGAVGLYQFNVRIPDLPPADVEVTAVVDGVRTPAGTFLSVLAVQYPGFNHSKFSEFRLTGKHVYTNCTSCHIRSRFAGTPDACRACHMADYASTTEPNHALLGFPMDCQACHRTSGFRPAEFGHTAGRFELTGAHASLECARCHTSGQYQALDAVCVSCHLGRYEATVNPNHAAAGFPKDCTACHNTTSFRGAQFSHSSTGFALTGAHTTQTCSACHANGQFSGLSTQCTACHVARYQAVQTPNHVAAGFPLDCSLCHGTTSFRGAQFSHVATGFELTGAHSTLQCASCHGSGPIRSLASECAACHLPRYQATTNPNHAAAGFPANCALCHTTLQFANASFDHALTSFPLTGTHQTVQCSSCHSSGVYNGLPAACVNCHLPRYQSTTNPNHVTAGFPTDCARCHSASQWPGARFTHTTFPLTGAHETLQCNRCHGDNVFAGKLSSCAACHLPRYQATTNPNHAAAKFPTDCALCHTTARFTGATFSHTPFPIYSGTHASRWSTCAACHTNPANFKDFSCLGCHTKSSTDSNHGGVGGYLYSSPNCYSCHPTGRG